MSVENKETRELRAKWVKEDNEIQQILGKALGYPWYFKDQKNFPGCTEEDGVCVGEQVGISLVDEAARRIKKLEKELSRLKKKYK